MGSEVPHPKATRAGARGMLSDGSGYRMGPSQQQNIDLGRGSLLILSRGAACFPKKPKTWERRHHAKAIIQKSIAKIIDLEGLFQPQ